MGLLFELLDDSELVLIFLILSLASYLILTGGFFVVEQPHYGFFFFMYRFKFLSIVVKV